MQWASFYPCCCSVTKSCLILCNPMKCTLKTSLSFTISWSLLKLMPIESVMPPTIWSSVAPFSSCPQSFPASRSFPMRWAFASGGQSIGTLASVLLMNIQGWFPSGLTGWISLQSKGLSSLLQHHSSKASFYLNSLYKVSISKFSNILELKILTYEWRGHNSVHKTPTLCPPNSCKLPAKYFHPITTATKVLLHYRTNSDFKISSKYHLNQVQVRFKLCLILREHSSLAVNMCNQTSYLGLHTTV